MARAIEVISRGRPPETSYWTTAPTHAALHAAIDARRHQQALPSDRDTHYDPMVSATADLCRRLTQLKVRAALRRRLARV